VRKDQNESKYQIGYKMKDTDTKRESTDARLGNKG